MMNVKRVCDSCGTPLMGRKGHGFVKNGKLVCGRSSREVGRGKGDEAEIVLVVTPGCRR